MLRQTQHVGRQQQAIGDDDHHVRLPVAQLRARGVTVGRAGAQRLRLRHGQAERERALLHFAGGEGEPAAGGPIGLRQDADDGVRAREGIEGRDGEGRRAGEDDAQNQAWREGRGVPRSESRERRSLSSFLRMRWRLSSER